MSWAASQTAVRYWTPSERLHPDVIVLDVNLPKIHGLEACRQVMRANPKVKIVVFTATIDPDIRQQFLEAGASRLCPRPVSRTCCRPSNSSILTRVERRSMRG
jgi:DNA-binding NarL/FixJ family response regulator